MARRFPFPTLVLAIACALGVTRASLISGLGVETAGEPWGRLIVTAPTCRAGAEIVARQAGRHTPVVRRQSCRAPKETLLLLEAGAWMLSIVGEGLWSAPVPAIVRGGESQTLSLTAVPGATLVGQVSGPNGSLPPKALALSLLSPEPSSNPQGREPQFECPITERTLRCSVPAGRRHVRLRAPGFISFYLWDLELTAGLTHEIPTLALVPGASISGFVESAGPVGQSPTGRVVAEIELAPEGVKEARNADLRRSLQFTGVRTRADSRGFFQLQGVAPGAYQLTARVPGLSPAEIPVQVLAGLELRLDPIRLEPPSTLEVEVSPPLQPNGQPWRIELLRQHGSRMRDLLSGAGTAPNGRFRRESLTAGTYLLLVRSQRNEIMVDHRVELPSGLLAVRLEIEALELRGRVIRGAEPLACIVRLRRRGSMERVEFSADEDGRFAGTITSEGAWIAEITTPTGQTIGLGRDVVVRRKSGRAEDLTLLVPDTEVRGRVIDQKTGQPADAVVHLTPVDSVFAAAQLRADASGEFSVLGLPEGRIAARASRPGASSRWLEVEVLEGEPQDVELRLEPELTIRGTVAGPNGPVGAARILVFPDSQSLISFKEALPALLTAADGTFEFQAPIDTFQADVLVDAPGHALQTLRTAVRSDAPLDFVLATDGGAISVTEQPNEGGKARVSTSDPMVHHRGAAFPLSMLAARGLQSRRDFVSGQVAQFLEPGDYRVCRQGATTARGTLGAAPGGSAAPCSEGFVFPDHTLEVEFDRFAIQ